MSISWPLWFVIFVAYDGATNYLKHVIKYIRGK